MVSYFCLTHGAETTLERGPTATTQLWNHHRLTVAGLNSGGFSPNILGALPHQPLHQQAHLIRLALKWNYWHFELLENFSS